MNLLVTALTTDVAPYFMLVASLAAVWLCRPRQARECCV
jgi:hypothetical protein